MLPLDEMQPAGGLHDAADLAGLEAERGVLELLLHVALAKVAEVAALAGAAAVGLGEGQLAEGDFAGLDLGLVGLDDLEGLVFGAGYLGLDAVSLGLFLAEPRASSFRLQRIIVSCGCGPLVATAKGS